MIDLQREREREIDMGACVSTPQGCVGGRLRSSKKKNRKRRKSFKTRVSSRLSARSQDKVDRSAPLDRHSSFNNPTFQGPFFSLSLFQSQIGFYYSVDSI